MAKKKRKTLPPDFLMRIHNASFEEQKAFFDSFELEATTSHGKQTALMLDLPDALTRWLVERGARLDARDRWQATPLHARARNAHANIQVLIDLGADLEATSPSGTPLHVAARDFVLTHVATLFAAGARRDSLDRQKDTPLLYAMAGTTNITLVKLVPLVRLFLDAGETIKARHRDTVTALGKTFEFHRSRINPDVVEANSAALETLYALTGVEPIARRVEHDGVREIRVTAIGWQAQHQALWELLVPSDGPAKTEQGEVIRIGGRITNEMLRNGGANWDDDYRRMGASLLAMVKRGNALSPEDIERLKASIDSTRRSLLEQDLQPLLELGVKWVLANPTPRALQAPKYSR